MVKFNNFILDVEDFTFDHPGGAFLLKANIGTDIGKYFYGVMAMEESVRHHEHSRFASEIASKMIIARLETSQKKVKIESKKLLEEQTETEISNTSCKNYCCETIIH